MANKTTPAVASALAGALALATAGTAGTASTAAAQSPVKCYGVALAGENDCANAAGTHSCAGQSTVDLDGGEWKLLTPDAIAQAGVSGSPQEVCEEFGSLEPTEGTGQSIPGLPGSDPAAT